MKKLKVGKIEPPKPWKNPFIEKEIISKLSYEEIEYLRGQGIFSQENIITELLNRAKRK